MRGHRGFTVTVTRVFYRGGAEVGRDRPETTVYRPEPKLACTASAGGAVMSVQGAVSDISDTPDPSDLVESDPQDAVISGTG